MMIIDFVDTDSLILDVGCNTGKLATEFVKKGCSVDGVEIDEEAAFKAKENCQHVFVGDAEKPEQLGIIDGKYDIILFADILEHLKNPADVLVKYAQFPKPNGSIICSIPNVANVSIRLLLLFGRWEYQEYGILDKTYLRFYTIESSRQLILNSGYDIQRIEYTSSIPPRFKNLLSDCRILH